MQGHKLAGQWELIRLTAAPGQKQPQWLLFKKRGDPWARPSADYDVLTALPDSISSTPLPLLPTSARLASAAESVIPTANQAPDLSRAVRSALPQTLPPQLASLCKQAPKTGQWLAENKFDGYRMMVRIESGQASLLTRNDHDWTAKLPTLSTDLQQLGQAEAWLDGELVALDKAGLPDFGLLQRVLGLSGPQPLTLFLFDAPFLKGMDLRQVPLLDPRAALRRLVEGSACQLVRFSPALPASPAALLPASCTMGLEGLMLKRADSPYVSGRSTSWLKLKCQLAELKPAQAPAERVARGLQAGVRTGVRTGVRNAVRKGEAQRRGATEHWVQPSVVVEVAFGGWTSDKHVRHAVYRGVRTDKAAKSLELEQAVPASPPAPLASAAAAPALNISHPNRIIDTSTGLRKIDLIRYYESVGAWMLPQLRVQPEYGHGLGQQCRPPATVGGRQLPGNLGTVNY